MGQLDKVGSKAAVLFSAITVVILLTSGCLSDGEESEQIKGGGKSGNLDTDGDGVANTVDAFPNDPAASVDTDGDGMPDSWNSGYTQSNSTTGLTLDPFPTDPNNGSGGGGGGGGGNNGTTNDTTGDTWTFMVYMSDCDLEYFAITDLNEMEQIGSTDKVNIVVQLDRWESQSERDDTSNGNWKTAKRFLVKQDSNADIIGSQELSDQGEINCGDPAQLTSFVKWAMQTYPAEHYFLDLWDHGDGIEGVCWDQSQGDDQLTIKELKTALSQITDNGKNKLDVIGFDACLMSTIEVAYEMAPYADHMIASEVTEPGTGWDYSFLGSLKTNPDMGPVDLGKRVVDTFIAQKTANPRQTHTLANIDLARTNEVKQQLDILIGTVRNSSGSEMDSMREARSNAQPVKKGSSSNMVDLRDYMAKIKVSSQNSQVQSGADKVISALNSMMTYFQKSSGSEDLDVSNAYGIAIYAPEFGLAQQEEYSDTSFQEDSSWDDLLADYYDQFQIDTVVYFVPESLLYVATDEDLDGWEDTIWIQFEINSLEDYIIGYLAVDVYDALGYLVDYLEYTFIINSDEYLSVGLGELGFALEEGDGEPGYYQMAIYMCLGTEFDIDYIQDYAETDLVWLEYYLGGGGGG